MNGNTGNGDVTFAYAKQGSQDFTEEVPTKAGKYTVRATVEATENYNGATATADFTISRQIVDTTPVSSLTVTSDLGTITRVTVDGKTVDSKYYTVSGNSVVLSDEFIRGLSNGTHTIRLYDGKTYATATWTVSGNDTPAITAPKTADPGVAIYGLLAVSSVLGLGYMGKKRKDD